jgi:hypothetical protein
MAATNRCKIFRVHVVKVTLELNLAVKIGDHDLEMNCLVLLVIICG